MISERGRADLDALGSIRRNTDVGACKPVVHLQSVDRVDEKRSDALLRDLAPERHREDSVMHGGGCAQERDAATCRTGLASRGRTRIRLWIVTGARPGIETELSATWERGRRGCLTGARGPV